MTYKPEHGDIVRGLSHRDDGIKHGVTVVIEGRIISGPTDSDEWLVKYNAPIGVDGVSQDRGWFRSNELKHLSWRER